MGAWRGYQRGNALDQLKWGECELVHLGTALVTGGLAVLFGAAVHQIFALFAQPIHRKRWASTVAQQPLQCGAVVCLDAHTSV